MGSPDRGAVAAHAGRYNRWSPRRNAVTEERRSHAASIIAIDGPAASGKSAIGAAVASRLRYRFIDTGSMYRAMTWLALRLGIDPNDAAALTRLADETTIDIREAPVHAGEPMIVMVDGEDATPHLRSSDVEANVSLVSRVPGVRARLVAVQRSLAAEGETVMAGRDIGTVVLPAADLKIYLDASLDIRARRRVEQMRTAGEKADRESVIADLKRRDGIDETRVASPLTAAPGAVIINTDQMSIEEVVSRILQLAA